MQNNEIPADHNLVSMGGRHIHTSELTVTQMVKILLSVPSPFFSCLNVLSHATPDIQRIFTILRATPPLLREPSLSVGAVYCDLIHEPGISDEEIIDAFSFAMERLTDVFKQFSEEDVVVFHDNIISSGTKDDIAVQITNYYVQRLNEGIIISNDSLFKIILDTGNEELAFLNLLSVDITIEDLVNIPTHFPNLKTLHLKQVDRLLDQSLSTFNDLRILRICETDNMSLLAIANHCPQLKLLNLSYMEINDIDRFDQCLKSLNPIERDFSIMLNGTKISDDTINIITEIFPKTISIELSECACLTKDGFEKLTQLSSLNLIALSGTQVDADSLIKILQGCKHIELLELEECNKIDFTKIFSAKNIHLLSQMRLLDLSYNDHLLQEHVVQIGCLVQLEELNISFCKNVVNFSWITQLSKLQRLSIDGQNIGDQQLKQITLECNQLEYVSFYECKNITYTSANSDNITILNGRNQIEDFRKDYLPSTIVNNMTAHDMSCSECTL